jgi:hypothetical protein
MMSLSLSFSFFLFLSLSLIGVEPILRGAASQVQQDVDLFYVDDVRNFLFGDTPTFSLSLHLSPSISLSLSHTHSYSLSSPPAFFPLFLFFYAHLLLSIVFFLGLPNSGGVDLAAYSIQRGRDHGLPKYNQIRQLLNLDPAIDFSDISRLVSKLSILSLLSREGIHAIHVHADIDNLFATHISNHIHSDLSSLPPFLPSSLSLSLSLSPSLYLPPFSPSLTHHLLLATILIHGISSPEIAARLEIYGSVDNVEGFVGGLAEDKRPLANLGSLFSSIVSQQYQNIR